MIFEMSRAITRLAVLIVAVMSLPALAQSAHTGKDMSLELANQIAAAAVASCAASNYAVTATVVDSAGSIRAMQRADNAGPHTLGVSLQKAYTSASGKSSTQTMLEASLKDPAAAYLVLIPGYLLRAGGVPVRVGNEVIGAVGVGGAPGGHLDEACANAAIEKVKGLLK